MKHCNNFRRMFRAAAVLAAVALMTFAGCTKVDDTLGSNLVPDNQQMKVGYTTLGARTLGAPEPPPSPGASRRLVSLSSEKAAG